MNRKKDNKALSAAIKKIGYQFGDTPEHKLMFAIVAQAIRDLAIPIERNAAKGYLQGSMPHAQLCGGDPDWIRLVLNRCDSTLKLGDNR